VSIVDGRGFDDADRRDAAPVALVSRALADEYFPGRSPVGTEITVGLSFDWPPVDRWTIVGVVDDIRSGSLTGEPVPEVYLPQAQMGVTSLVYLLRADVGLAALQPQIKSLVEQVLPGIPAREPRTLQSVLDDAIGPARFYMSVLIGFAALSVGLAAIGLYGVIAYAAATRRHEIAVRMALGARAGAVVALMLRQGARPLVAGLALGLGIAATGAHLLETLLYGVSPYDAVGWTAAVAIVAIVGLTASALPAQRASRESPVRALHGD